MVIALGQDTPVHAEALAIARELRHAGVTVHLDTRFGKADRQFKLAERLGARAAVILGTSELEAGTLNLKDLAARTQRAIPRTQVVDEVRALLASPVTAQGETA